MMNQTDVLNGLRGTDIEKKKASEYIGTLLTESDKRGCRDKVDEFVKKHTDAKIWCDVAELHGVDDFFARVLQKDQAQTTLATPAPADTAGCVAVAPASSTTVSLANPLTGVYLPTKEEIAMLRQTVVTDTRISDEQIKLLIVLAQKYNLDPFKREIWATTTGILIARDGFLTFAHRSGDFDGMDTDFGFDGHGNLESATTTVWNKKMSHPIKFTAYYKEYGYGKKSPTWVNMPKVMLQKCAEANALRRAFGITGLYDETELSE